MPTTLEFWELIDVCTWTWTTQKGQTGYKVVGPNGNSIFLPAVGCRDGDVNKIDDLYGRYWSSSHGARPTTFATFLKFSENYYEMGHDSYFYGLPVRPILNDTLRYDFSDEPYHSEEGTHNGHEYVDLGLSVKWATCNVGADSPEEYGDYYAWGETRTKNFYIADNCATYNQNINDIKCSNRDVAHVIWGGNWRMPTHAEFEELTDICTWTWTTQNDKRGYKVTGPNGKSIFLPAVGYFYQDEVLDDGLEGNYWSSIPCTGDTQGAYSLYFVDEYQFSEWDLRCLGYTIRPVLDY